MIKCKSSQELINNIHANKSALFKTPHYSFIYLGEEREYRNEDKSLGIYKEPQGENLGNIWLSDAVTVDDMLETLTK